MSRDRGERVRAEPRGSWGDRCDRSNGSDGSDWARGLARDRRIGLFLLRPLLLEES